jgi:hypothetical protein
MRWRLQKPWRGAKLAQYSRCVPAFSSRLAPTHAHLDYVSSANAGRRASDRRFVISAAAHTSMTLLPFPTGRKFSKKIFIFLRSDSKLAQNSLDNRLLSNVRCISNERGRHNTRPASRREGCHE